MEEQSIITTMNFHFFVVKRYWSKREKGNTKEDMKMRCNHCGKEIKAEHDRIMEGVADITLRWGYFSKKDGEIHRFSICEECYDAWIKEFAIPVTIEEETELL